MALGQDPATTATGGRGSCKATPSSVPPAAAASPACRFEPVTTRKLRTHSAALRLLRACLQAASKEVHPLGRISAQLHENTGIRGQHGERGLAGSFPAQPGSGGAAAPATPCCCARTGPPVSLQGCCCSEEEDPRLVQYRQAKSFATKVRREWLTAGISTTAVHRRQGVPCHAHALSVAGHR